VRLSALSNGGAARLLVSVFVLLLVPQVVHAQLDPASALERLFLSPQRGSIAHLVLFSALFYGLVVQALVERFGSSGKMVALAVSLLMASSLAVTGRLNLVAFEPLAGVAVFAVIGMAAALAFRKLNDTGGWGTAGAIGYLVGYSALRVAAPSLESSLRDFILVPELLYAGAFVWVLYRFATSAMGSAGASREWLAHAQRTLPYRPAQDQKRVQEEAVLPAQVAEAAGGQVRDHAASIAALDETERVARNAQDPAVRQAIAARLAAFVAARRGVEERYKQFRQLVERLTRLDTEEYAALGREFEQLPSLEIKAEALQELNALRAKLKSDEILSKLGQAIRANEAASQVALERARTALEAGDTRSFRSALDDAKSTEREAMRLAAQCQRFADRLKGAAAQVVAKARMREPTGVA